MTTWLEEFVNNNVVCQVRILLEKAHAISQKWGNAPVALAGDFNSTPGVREVLYPSSVITFEDCTKGLRTAKLFSFSQVGGRL